MNKNKRQFIRLSASVRILIIPYEVTDERLLIKDEKDVSTKNISAGGILFRSNQTLPVNSLVEVKIFLPFETIPRIRCRDTLSQDCPCRSGKTASAQKNFLRCVQEPEYPMWISSITHSISLTRKGF